MTCQFKSRCEGLTGPPSRLVSPLSLFLCPLPASWVNSGCLLVTSCCPWVLLGIVVASVATFSSPDYKASEGRESLSPGFGLVLNPFGCSLMERLKLKRQLLVKRKLLYSGSWQPRKMVTRVLRPSPKRYSERERFKGELGSARRGLAANQQLTGRLAGVRRLCASELPWEWNVFICGIQEAPGKILETLKGLVRGQHGGNVLACLKMEWVRLC